VRRWHRGGRGELGVDGPCVKDAGRGHRLFHAHGVRTARGRSVHKWPVTLLMRLQQALLHPHPMESNPAWVQTGVTMLSRIRLSSRPRSILASCDIRAAPTRVQRFAGSAEREMIPRADLYSE
jgi:hypothetical protein